MGGWDQEEEGDIVFEQGRSTLDGTLPLLTCTSVVSMTRR